MIVLGVLFPKLIMIIVKYAGSVSLGSFGPVSLGRSISRWIEQKSSVWFGFRLIQFQKFLPNFGKVYKLG